MRAKVLVSFLLCLGISFAQKVSALESESESSEPVKGLAVTLATPKERWVINDLIEFDATLKNVSEKSFLIDTFGELNGLYLGKHASQYIPSCWVLAWEGKSGPTGLRGKKTTLEPNQFILIMPGAMFTKHLSLKLTDVAPGKYRVRLAYAPRAAGPSFSFPNKWEEQHQIHDPMWIGMAYSNPITIEVTK